MCLIAAYIMVNVEILRGGLFQELDWCGGHNVPESKCTICNPKLIPQFKASGDWCAEHGLPESVCPSCNPQPTRQTRALPEKDWCEGHGVPESKCTICNPKLIPQFKASGDWCAEHGLPESVCPSCNPQPTRQTRALPEKDWCEGHGVPESKCTICNPELISQFKASGDWCVEHGLPESVCPICNPNSMPPEVIESRIVRFKSPDHEDRAGILVARATLGQAGKTIHGTAQFVYHADRVADLRVLIPGVIRTAFVGIGEKVTRGAPSCRTQRN